jgi:hypothetical protein
VLRRSVELTVIRRQTGAGPKSTFVCFGPNGDMSAIFRDIC